MQVYYTSNPVCLVGIGAVLGPSCAVLGAILVSGSVPRASETHPKASQPASGSLSGTPGTPFPPLGGGGGAGSGAGNVLYAHVWAEEICSKMYMKKIMTLGRAGKH